MLVYGGKMKVLTLILYKLSHYSLLYICTALLLQLMRKFCSLKAKDL